MAKNKTGRKAKKTVGRNIPKGDKKISDIVSARKHVGTAAFELAKCRLAAKQATERYNTAIERLLGVIDNDKTVPLFEQPARKVPAKSRPAKKVTNKK